MVHIRFLKDALFSSPKGSLTIALEGSKAVLATSIDLLSPKCHSSIGDLKTVSVFKNSNGVVTSAHAVFRRTVDFSYTRTLIGHKDVFLAEMVASRFRDKSGPKLNIVRWVVDRDVH